MERKLICWSKVMGSYDVIGAIREGLPHETSLEQGSELSEYPEEEWSRQRGGKCKGPGAGAAMKYQGNSRKRRYGWSSGRPETAKTWHLTGGDSCLCSPEPLDFSLSGRGTCGAFI